ncbi:hypothetical protein L2105_15105, partial [Citrobacter portucalensis]|uniref:hypothetical protein n=1 Tax=Citrobacter portucalensis TaxID=1639133 RepID=UPI0023B22CCC
LLKSSAASLFLSGAGCAYYAIPLRSQAFNFASFAGVLSGTPLTRRLVIRCSVSVEAHYRELFQADKGKFKITFRVRVFSPKQPLTCHKISKLPFLQPQSHFQVAY